MASYFIHCLRCAIHCNCLLGPLGLHPCFPSPKKQRWVDFVDPYISVGLNPNTTILITPNARCSVAVQMEGFCYSKCGFGKKRSRTNPFLHLGSEVHPLHLSFKLNLNAYFELFAVPFGSEQLTFVWFVGILDQSGLTICSNSKLGL